MRLSILNAELAIHEFALLSNTSLFYITPDFQRLESLYACLHASRSWFDLFLTISPALYPGIPFSLYTQMSHNVVASYRLATFEGPDWDLTAARQTINPSIVLDQIIQNMSQVRDLAGLNSGDGDISDPFTEVAKRLSSIKGWWDAKFGPPLGAEVPVFDEVAAMNQSMAFWDEGWLSEALPGPWLYQPELYHI